MNDFWIISTAILVATSTAILGCFLMLRKMAMIGDAISHAVLPGIVLAYFATHSRAGFPILVGAAISGLLVVYFIQFFNKKVKLHGVLIWHSILSGKTHHYGTDLDAQGDKRLPPHLPHV